MVLHVILTYIFTQNSIFIIFISIKTCLCLINNLIKYFFTFICKNNVSNINKISGIVLLYGDVLGDF